MRPTARTLCTAALVAFSTGACAFFEPQVPTADAGPDQAVAVAATVTLDGSGSFAPGGATLTYQWAFESVPVGSGAALTGATTATPSFTADVAGAYVVSLVVSDGTKTSSPDTVTVTASDVDDPPVADAGPDQRGTLGAPATLDGSASADPEAVPLTYQWTVEFAPTGSVATLSSATAAQPTFTPDVEGTWVFALTVSDGVNTSTVDRMLLTTLWHLNLTNQTAAVFTNPDASPILVEVQALDALDLSGTLFLQVNATGIPAYQHTLTAADVNWLNNVQPDSKFVNNSGTTLTAGAILDFGADVGFQVIDGCFAGTGGGGWFPPGPTCPSDQAHQVFLPLVPQPAVQSCFTQVNAIGIYRNGVSMFNWSDDESYLDQGIWHQLAAKFEAKDLDLCASHANQDGDYHHHLIPNCLAEQIGDAGTAHSPIYGYAADGYPVHGPWHANGVRAQSCWKTRDYDTPSPVTGCGTAKKRTCLLVDRLDPTQGTVAAANPGPDTDAVELSHAMDPYTVVSGFYFEDYWFDAACAAAGGEFLDEHNGHDHDGLGYHYHQTDEFPYNVGPEYAGELFPNAIQSCSATPAAAASAAATQKPRAGRKPGAGPGR